MPLISIIVPVYNVEKYISKCIDSILAQTFTDFELILVNDGSTDSSYDICEEYAKADSRIQLMNLEWSGLSSARNSGIDKARGKYIAFVDSDDWIHKDMLRILYKILIDADADISQCGIVKKFGEGTSERTFMNTKEVYTNLEMLHKMQEERNIENKVVWNKLYRKNLFQTLRFPKGKIHEDEFINYKLFFMARKVVCTDCKLCYYRQRRTSITGARFRIERLDKIEALIERVEFYKKLSKELYQKEIAHLLDIILYSYHQVKGNIQNNGTILRNLQALYAKYLLRLVKARCRIGILFTYSLYAVFPELYHVGVNK